MNGLPASHDYQAGVIYLTSENNHDPDGKTEGLGVRAFGVNTSSLRAYGSNGRAKIEGSRHVSGGTGPNTFFVCDPNGPPHVNEIAYFNFNPGHSGLAAESVRVLLSDFDYDAAKAHKQDKIDLHIELRSGGTVDRLFVGPSNDVEGLFEDAGTDPGKDKLWMLNFSALGELLPGDVIASFSISAVDDYPTGPTNTAEHFFITGFTATEMPEPATVSLIAVGLVAMVFGRKRR